MLRNDNHSRLFPVSGRHRWDPNWTPGGDPDVAHWGKQFEIRGGGATLLLPIISYGWVLKRAGVGDPWKSTFHFFSNRYNVN